MKSFADIKKQEHLKYFMKNIVVLSMFSLSLIVSADDVNISISVNGNASGSVLSVDGAINCTDSCDLVADSDELLNLRPSPLSTFSGWSNSSCDFGNDILASNTFIDLMTSTAAKTVFASDLDGDGDEDTITTNLIDKTITRHLNNGNGVLASELVIDFVHYPSSVVAVDWDSDGDNDILGVAHSEDKVYLYLNNGDATFAEREEILLPVSSVYAVYPADVDNDGDLDLLVSSFDAILGTLDVLENSIINANISWYLNDGSFQFTDSILVAADMGAITLSAADMDGDDDIDVVAALLAEDKSVYFENNGGVFDQMHTIVSSDGAYGVSARDIDGDGDTDVLTVAYWSQTVYLSINDGNGTLSSRTLGVLSSGVSGSEIVDLNGDGLLDVLVGEFNRGFFWYENLSLIECSLLPQEGSLIAATFSTTQVNGGTRPTSSGSDSSGGGAFGSLFFCFFILILLVSNAVTLTARQV